MRQLQDQKHAMKNLEYENRKKILALQDQLISQEEGFNKRLQNSFTQQSNLSHQLTKL